MQKGITYIVMGVTGCGKSTIGEMLASSLGIPFYDGDDFHPEANVTKMSQGTPLTDQDRLPWLKILCDNIGQWNKSTGAVLACSALKQQYRAILSRGNAVQFLYLKASQDLIKKRLQQRTDHFMPSSLIKSQFEALEAPEDAMILDASLSSQEIIKHIKTELLTTMKEKSGMDIGLIGLGVMGKSLARNFESRGYGVAVYNLPFPGEEEKVKQFTDEFRDKQFYGANDLKDFVGALASPRKIVLMITAGEPVDQMIEQLTPLLDQDDIIIDAGNSHFSDSERRYQSLKSNGFRFIGLGVSGGEEGALKGPSLMPGCEESTYLEMEPVLKAIAAIDRDGNACVTHIGKGGSGHFVKMVHNGLEYADMQMIAEIYGYFKSAIGYSNLEIASIFEEWNKTELGGYLMEISVDILRHQENDNYTLDKILDVAGNKGTGKWVVHAALDLGVPIPSISEAVFARYQSTMCDVRQEAFLKYKPGKINGKLSPEGVNSIKDALYAAKLMNYIQGFDLIKSASDQFNWDINMANLANIWKAGCIIRSELLYVLSELKMSHHLILEDQIIGLISKRKSALSQTMAVFGSGSVHAPVISASFNYLNGITRDKSTANMIQAQRDYFGAHQYERLDQPRGTFFHTNWITTND